MRELTDLKLVPREKIEQHRAIWTVVARALNQARRIQPDNNSTGFGGTYVTATEGLSWLLSADAYLWLEQIKCGEVLKGLLLKIQYKDLFERIANAARSSAQGRAWLQTSPEFAAMEKLVQEADVFFKASQKLVC